MSIYIIFRQDEKKWVSSDRQKNLEELNKNQKKKVVSLNRGKKKKTNTDLLDYIVYLR